MTVTLSPVETRVLGCLIEKSMTTPEYYPLTLNALTAACNQKSNRDPAMQLEDTEVVRALDSLREKRLAWIVTLAGSRVAKYRHSVLDVYPFSLRHLAVLCELMLRGPQTAGELRARAARMTAFTDVGEAQAALNDLAAWEGGALARRLPRQPGQREERYAHLLSGEPPPTEAAEAAPVPEPARRVVAAENEHIASLEARFAALQDEVDRLKARFDDFAKQFQ